MVWQPPSKTKYKHIFYGRDVVRKMSVKNGENNNLKTTWQTVFQIYSENLPEKLLKTKPTQEPGMQHSQDNLVIQELQQYFLFKHGAIHILFANFCKIAIFFIPDS